MQEDPMPRPSVRAATEMPQKQPRRNPPSLRTSITDSDPIRPRLTTPRSPKLGDRRSPRSVQSDPVTKKKFGTRISDLESRLEEAQEELKSLKEQLASAEVAKQKAQEELQKKAKNPVTRDADDLRVEHPSNEIQELADNQRETDVFEVPREIASLQSNSVGKFTKLGNQETNDGSDLVSKKDEITLFETKLTEKESELVLLLQQKEDLKRELTEANLKLSSAHIREDETSSKLVELLKELEESKANEVNLNNKLQSAKQANEKMEGDMKLVRVQTEQWRKAADAAAAILAGELDLKGRGISERCGSMDKLISNGVFEPLDGGGSSPLIGDGFEDGFGGSKRKGNGIKMFGDLWKKKGQKS